MRVVPSLILLLVKICIIGSASAVQGSRAFFPVFPPREETLGPHPIQHGESWRSSAPSSPSESDGYVVSPSPATMPVYPSPRESWRTIAPSTPAGPNGPSLHPPVPPPTSAPMPENITGSEPSASPSPSAIILSPPYKVVSSPSTLQGQLPPSVQPSPSRRKAPTLMPPVSTHDTPVGQPIEHDLPHVNKRNANESHNLEPVSPAPVAVPSTDFPKYSPANPPTEDGRLPPIVHKGDANKGHTREPSLPAPVVSSTKLPNSSPFSQPTGHGSLPPNVHRRNASTDHTLEPVSPSPIAIPPAILPKISPVSQPTSTPNVHKRTGNQGHMPEAVSPAPVVSPPSTPSRIFNWKKGGAPVATPLYKTPKPLPAVIRSPAQAPATHKAVWHFHRAPKPLVTSHSFNKEFHSPASSPSTSLYKHHHKRSIITSPAPASSSYLVSPPTSIHQGQAIPPSLLPTSGRRHYAPPPVNSVSPFSFPLLPPMSQVSHAPSPASKFGPHPTKIPLLPPKISPYASSSRSPMSPVLPQVQALPPPPPNEDCLSTVCTEPYTNSPPGAPCRCVWPMQIGLRLSVSLYTFFPLVSELASEIAAGVFMKQSQVRIMGAKSANQQPEKTDVLIDLVPLGEKFDHTTAFLTSERFWHKQVIIKASYFGDYEVLYVSYPGLPPSPPLPPSSITMIDGGPYSNDGNNGRTIKPLGVDIQKRQHKRGLSSGIIAIICLSVFVAVVLCSAAAWVLLFKRRDHVSQTPWTPRVLPSSLTKASGTVVSLTGGGPGSAASSFRSSIAAYTGSAKTFSMNDIERATNNFHSSRILGEGGFGRVYSGILEDGIKVAVKVLKREDHHGDREFLAEVEMLSRLHHRNLVKLIGICTEESFRCLVYELIANGSVESHLHGVDRETSPIDWGARMKIALGAARGLAYLHEDSSPRVIHRDFKSSNILLEDDFIPKVSDFGLARTATDEENRHISTRVMGTFGYVAPEYAMTGHLLVKSDVYSYGVVLLELLTGRKPVDMSQPPGQENLVAWARPLLTSKEGLEAIIDPSLGFDVPFDSVAKVAAIASMCVQPEVSNRPFMGEVVQALKLVCNECDEAKEAGSRISSQEDLSIDLDTGVSTVSGQLRDNFQCQHLAANYDSGVDIERELSASELFSSSGRFGRQASGSFRRHNYSGPLRTGRSRRLCQIIRRLSGGSVSEHGIMFKS